jgi:uncharacterized cupin superfamily protein
MTPYTMGFMGVGHIGTQVARAATSVVRAGETINIPANAPHQLHNRSAQPARLLCICAPSGQEEFFLARIEALAPLYRRELLPPSGKDASSSWA